MIQPRRCPSGLAGVACGWVNGGRTVGIDVAPGDVAPVLICHASSPLQVWDHCWCRRRAAATTSAPVSSSGTAVHLWPGLHDATLYSARVCEVHVSCTYVLRGACACLDAFRSLGTVVSGSAGRVALWFVPGLEPAREDSEANPSPQAAPPWPPHRWPEMNLQRRAVSCFPRCCRLIHPCLFCM
jgi:hypothetical protein